MKKLIILLLLISINSFAALVNCESAKIKKLDFAFTYNPDSSLKRSLKKYSKIHKLKLNLTTLSKAPKEIKFENFDFIIIPGGADIDPKTYMDRISTEAQNEITPLLDLVNYSQEGKKRDGYELATIDHYLKLSNTDFLPPLYGICRGMQILLVSQGIPLYIDIETQLKINNRINLTDTIYLEKITESIFYQVFNNSSNKIDGFKWHHQGGNVKYLKNFSKNFYFTSFSNQGKILESFEFKDYPILGVQFHPEGSGKKIEKKFFEEILNKACLYKSIK